MTILHDTFILHRSFPHSRKRLFAALSDPALKRRWHANPTTETELFESDFRIGGADRQRYVLGAGSPFPGHALENDPAHQAEAFECKRAARCCKLAGGNVTPRLELRLRILERREYEEIGLLVVSRLAQSNAVHHPITKCELRHRSQSLVHRTHSDRAGISK